MRLFIDAGRRAHRPRGHRGRDRQRGGRSREGDRRHRHLRPLHVSRGAGEYRDRILERMVNVEIRSRPVHVKLASPSAHGGGAPAGDRKRGTGRRSGRREAALQGARRESPALGESTMKLGTSLRFLFPTSPQTHEAFRRALAAAPAGSFIERPMGAYEHREQARNWLEVAAATRAAASTACSWATTTPCPRLRQLLRPRPLARAAHGRHRRNAVAWSSWPLLRAHRARGADRDARGVREGPSS